MPRPKGAADSADTGHLLERDAAPWRGVLTHMRVVLVGTPADRQRLRGQLGDSVEIVAETATLGAARRMAADADAYLVAAMVEAEPLLESLTPRESQVLALVADGLSNKAIASRLGLSDETVKFHLASIFGKLGASNRTDAVSRAIRQGLIPL
jgi:DNA-binding CsgD family transcriptional regulator